LNEGDDFPVKLLEKLYPMRESSSLLLKIK